MEWNDILISSWENLKPLQKKKKERKIGIRRYGMDKWENTHAGPPSANERHPI
jgi:hypothetical protein